MTLGDYPGQRALELTHQTVSGQVTLAWKAVDGAVNYKILSNWQKAANVTGTSWSGPLPGIETGYLVTAYDAGGRLLSAEGVKVLVSAPAPKPPARPRGLRMR